MSTRNNSRKLDTPFINYLWGLNERLELLLLTNFAAGLGRSKNVCLEPCWSYLSTDLSSREGRLNRAFRGGLLYFFGELMHPLVPSSSDILGARAFLLREAESSLWCLFILWQKFRIQNNYLHDDSTSNSWSFQ